MRSLARYHAASVACYKDDAGLLEQIGKEQIYVEGGPFLNDVKTWMESSVRTIGETLLEMDGYEEIAKYIISRIDHVASSLVSLFEQKKKGLNVLNHGDLCVNNMLFRHSSTGEVVDFMFIDFQIPRFTTPVVDLVYFLWTSGNEDVRETKQEEL